MQLESYIDQLNNAIEGLESEQLTVTNNIINLKAEYNRSKQEYDELTIKLDQESKRYSALVMQNARMTFTQNKDITDQIDRDRISVEKKLEELKAQELELLTKMSEICEKENYLNEKSIQISRIKDEIDRREQIINHREVVQTAKESKITAQIQSNEKLARDLSDRESNARQTKEKADKEIEKLAKERSLHKNEYEMKLRDLERREDLIRTEMMEISSQWKALKNAKAHIDSMKTG